MSSIIDASTIGSVADSKTQDSQKRLNGTLDDFLKLLTTQLQNQDPTDPADTNQVTQQIASLSQVEQQINTNSNLERLISIFGASQTANAVSYIGNQVDASGNQGVLAGGGAHFVYDLPASASEVTVHISNASGAEVYSAPAPSDAGRNEIAWDGLSENGTQYPDGVYSFRVVAKNNDGEDMQVRTYTTGLVTSVDVENGATTLSLGEGLSIPIEDVQSIRGIFG